MENSTLNAPSKRDIKFTIAACYFGAFTQAAVAGLPPLFYSLYNEQLGLSLQLIALFPTLFFGLQIIIDGLFSGVVAKIGYKRTAMLADAFSMLGLILLGFTPLFPSPTAVIFISTVLCAIGSGIIEITASPLIEALPNDNKSSAMSFLHSFYCWGYLFVILLTTGFFALFGKEKWFVLPFVFALIPIIGGMLYIPIKRIVTLEEQGSVKFSSFGKNSLFVLLFLMMVCAGAGEQVVSQWASFFVEKGLGISKTLGDLFGTSAFALCMALARTFFGAKTHKSDICKSLLISVIILAAAYLLTALSPVPAISVIGVGLCGLSVGILWPCTLSLAGESGLNGGTLMFALLALAGDIGCTLGPTLAGEISAATSINVGLLAGVIFPVINMILLIVYKSAHKKKITENVIKNAL